LKADFDAPKLLIGHSLGGAAVLQAASGIPSILAVVTIAAPANLSHLTGLLGSSREQIIREGQARIQLAGRDFSIKKQFLDDLEDTHMKTIIGAMKKPLLIIHSAGDRVVSMDNALQIFESAAQPKSFIALEDADHLLSNREDSVYVGAVMAAWAKRYVGTLQEAGRGRDLRDNRVIVRTGKSGYQTEITAGPHRLIADEPIAVGGADTGPSPYDYLVAALGACTSMTLRMYADLKKLPLDSVIVRLRHEKVHADDCQECEEQSRTIDVIDREIELVGPLQESERTRLLQIADRCPVHRTLHSGIRVTSRLKDAGLIKEAETEGSLRMRNPKEQ
jgi:putative redox protein